MSEEPATPETAKTPKPKPKRRKREAGVALGAAIVGFEQAVFRTLPPPHEVVAKARHDGPVAAADGTLFTIVMPDDSAEATDE